MIVHVMTNYFCDYNCEYCYLGSLKKDPKIIDFELLDSQLQELSNNYDITKIELYGGEITLLPLDDILRVIRISKKYSDTISMITNLRDINIVEEINRREDILFAVSVNDERDHNDELLSKVLMLEKIPNSILHVATPSTLKKTPKEVFDDLLRYGTPNIAFLQYFPADPADVNYHNITNQVYADFLKGIIKEYRSKNYNVNLCNIDSLDYIMEGKYTSLMDGIIFIDPYNRYNYVAYNSTGEEYFKPVKNLEEFKAIAKKEKEYFLKKCSGCKYFGKCYADHLKDWREGDDCCGLKSLLDWYGKENICENDK